MEAQLPETEAAVTEIRVDTEAIRVVPWQEVLKQEMSDRLNDGCSWTYRNGTADRRCGDLQKNCFREKKYKGYAAEMKKLRTFAVSMIIAAIGLLIYCAGFYIKSYEQNLAARQEYAELSKMAGVKNRAGAGLLADGKKLMKTAVQKTVKKTQEKQRRSSESKNKNCTDEIRESFGISWEI